MKRDDLGAAVRPDDEIARRVHRYERALIGILQQRREEERTAPITNEEHLLAMQVAENVTAYERGLRAPPLPARKEAATETAPRPAKRPRRAAPAKGRRRKRARRKAPQKPVAAPQEG